jgi:hypothetical protein
MIVDVIADYVQNWLEDNINPVIYQEMEKTINNYSDKDKFNSEVTNLFEGMMNTRMMSFEEQLTKFETIE